MSGRAARRLAGDRERALQRLDGRAEAGGIVGVELDHGVAQPDVVARLRQAADTGGVADTVFLAGAARAKPPGRDADG